MNTIASSAEKKTRRSDIKISSASVAPAGQPTTIPAFLIKLLGKIPKVGGKVNPEDRICIDFVANLQRWTLNGQLDAVWFHVVNEFAGDKKPVWAAIRIALGRINGVADYVFLCPLKSLALEFKAPGKPQSDYQKAFEQWCKDRGVPYHVCYSVEDGTALLVQYGILRL